MPSSSARASFRFLEWGEASREPRSSVGDADGRYVFTGSPVRRGEDVGTVLELLSPREVRVGWSDGTESVIASRVLVVTGLSPLLTGLAG